MSRVVLQLDVKKPNKSDILGNEHGLNKAWILPWNFAFIFSLKKQKFSDQSITMALGENADVLMLECISIQREPSVLCCQAANYSQKRLKLSMVFPNDLILYSELKIHYVKCWCGRKVFVPGYKVVMVFRLIKSRTTGRMVARKYTAARQLMSWCASPVCCCRVNNLLLTISPSLEGVADFDLWCVGIICVCAQGHLAVLASSWGQFES